MKKIRGQAAQEYAVFELRQAGLLALVKSSLEIRRQIPELGHFRHGSDQGVLVGMINLGERADQIPNVSADAEVRYPAGIEDNPVGHGDYAASYTVARASFQP